MGLGFNSGLHRFRVALARCARFRGLGLGSMALGFRVVGLKVKDS